MKRFFTVAAASAVLSLTALVGSAAANPPGTGSGVFTIDPNGQGGGAACVGPVEVFTGPQGDTPGATGAWNGHFNSGGVVTHDFTC